jgi:hypothetical protein
MRRKLSFILTMMLALTAFLLAVVPAQAQPITTLADTRERVNGILVQLRTFDNTCVVILGALLHEVDIDILAARRLITVGKGNLTNLLLDYFRSAVFGFDRVQDTIEQCETLLGATEPASAGLNVIPAFRQLAPQAQEESDGTIVGEVEAVLEEVESSAEEGGLDLRKAFKIVSLINNIILPNLDCVDSRLESIDEVVQSASSDTESLFDEVEGGLNGGTSELDVLLSSARVLPELTETGPFPFEDLREFKIRLGLIHQELVQILRAVKRIVYCKKWVYKAVREIYWLLRASNFGGRAASELSEGLTRIYTLSGQLVSTQTFGLSTDRLANGVYLAVKQFTDKTGQVRYETQKLVVAR